MTPADYIAQADPAKRSDLSALDALIRKTVPRLSPYMEGRILGYGRYHYRYASGHEGDSCRIGLACTKGGFSLYIQAYDANGYLAEQAKGRLGKVSVGKACVRFKRLADLTLPTVIELLTKAASMATTGADSFADDPTAKRSAPAKTAPPAKKSAKTSAPAKTSAAVKKRATKKKAAAPPKAKAAAAPKKKRSSGRG